MIKTTEELKKQWDVQVKEMIQKYFPDGYPPEPPVVPPCIKFPFMVVFHRNKISSRNNDYLVAVAVFKMSDLAVCKRSLKHKGWPNMTLMFDLPEFMKNDHFNNRHIYWFYRNWDDIERHLSPTDKMLLPDLKELYPCPITRVKDKKGQFKLVF